MFNLKVGDKRVAINVYNLIAIEVENTNLVFRMRDNLVYKVSGVKDIDERLDKIMQLIITIQTSGKVKLLEVFHE